MTIANCARIAHSIVAVGTIAPPAAPLCECVPSQPIEPTAQAVAPSTLEPILLTKDHLAAWAVTKWPGLYRSCDIDPDGGLWVAFVFSHGEYGTYLTEDEAFELVAFTEANTGRPVACPVMLVVGDCVDA